MAAGVGQVLAQLAVRGARVGIIVVLLALSTTSWAARSEALYLDDASYGVHSVAYALIAERIEPSDVIFGQHLRAYYAQDPAFRGIALVSMESDRSFAMTDLEDALAGTQRAWVTWEARKSYHLREDVRQAIRDHGLQVSGPGMDRTRVFVYLIER